MHIGLPLPRAPDAHLPPTWGGQGRSSKVPASASQSISWKPRRAGADVRFSPGLATLLQRESQPGWDGAQDGASYGDG